ncbi:Uncharacterised protein [Klebsiella pneumoniae]|uniref:Uncharacterized protein n=1 Tax=Klebsiella pneumoniae TaxID=573 RepID=A0A377TIL5_KLEPN|nr:Uncharacterised protein [Klebsiella pneumoniae]
MSANFRHFAAHAFKPLLDKRFQGLAFRFAGDDEVVQRAVKSGQNVGGDGVEILLFGGHHARPAQDINRVDSPSSLCIFTQLAAFTSCLASFSLRMSSP